ncbi:MAG: tetratricopeptide repeat protein [Pseudobdellovibrionaceae bacterium]
MKPKTFFDSNLREQAESPDEVHEHIAALQIHLLHTIVPSEIAKVLGEIGNWFKILGLWEKAIEHFEKARQSSPKGGLLAALELRLADTYRLMGNYNEALIRFQKFSQQEASIWMQFEDFYHQHLGKLHFDQQNYDQALKCFQSAWVLREKKGNSELLKSTERAIQETLKRISVE